MAASTLVLISSIGISSHWKSPGAPAAMAPWKLINTSSLTAMLLSRPGNDYTSPSLGIRSDDPGRFRLLASSRWLSNSTWYFLSSGTFGRHEMALYSTANLHPQPTLFVEFSRILMLGAAVTRKRNRKCRPGATGLRVASRKLSPFMLLSHVLSCILSALEFQGTACNKPNKFQWIVGGDPPPGTIQKKSVTFLFSGLYFLFLLIWWFPLMWLLNFILILVELHSKFWALFKHS